MKDTHGCGIDFGTTNSVMALYDSESVFFRPYLHNNLPHPSVVWYHDERDVTVGQAAKMKVHECDGEPGHTFVTSIKSKLGSGERIKTFNGPRSIPDVASEIFKHLKSHAASAQKPYHIESAVVTIPVCFDGRRRAEIREAANLAGIRIRTFLHEPFAAVFGYLRAHPHLVPTGADLRNLVVFDWGGGTLDITVVRIDSESIRELATAGLQNRSGDHFDGEMLRLVECSLAQRLGLNADQLSIMIGKKGRLLNLCESAKIQLSNEAYDRSRVLTPGAYRVVGGDQVDVEEEISRDDFERRIEKDVFDALRQLDCALKGSGLNETSIDQVLMIGGSSLIPLVRREMVRKFGNSKLCVAMNAPTIIAEGAAFVHAHDLRPVLAKDLVIRLEENRTYRIFQKGHRALGGHISKTVPFFCTDPTHGEAHLFIEEEYHGKSSFKHNVIFPVRKGIPAPGFFERVQVDFEIDQDLVLQVYGRAATQECDVRSAIYDLCFGFQFDREALTWRPR